MTSPRTSRANKSTLPDRGRVLTEQRLAASAHVDALPTEKILRLINSQDATVPGVVRRAIPQLARLVDWVVDAITHGGRLIYLGAGTSGRLGVLDASECPPTFFSPPGMVVGLIAGGDGALRHAVEGAEDNPLGANGEFKRLRVGRRDVVVGITAGGTTPYVLGALKHAKRMGTRTALITCAPSAPQTRRNPRGSRGAATPGIDLVVPLPVGPEVVTGSTRMKAGTATKLALNMISTAAMVRLGKTWGNLMVDLRATNAKLYDRAARILTTQSGMPRSEALALLNQAQGRVKVALVMALQGLDAGAARKKLEKSKGRLRPILGTPRKAPRNRK